MAKRARVGETLTGGTKDVNPQYLSGTITLTAANTFTAVSLQTPIVRVGPTTGNTAIIMEVLKIYCDMPIADADAAAATIRSFSIAFTTKPFLSFPQFNETTVFAFFQHVVRNAFTAAGTGALDFDDSPKVYDCTDAAGHGVLIATDSIFINATSSNQTAANRYDWKILYRFKRVALAEYIGIVQSQQ